MNVSGALLIGRPIIGNAGDNAFMSAPGNKNESQNKTH